MQKAKITNIDGLTNPHTVHAVPSDDLTVGICHAVNVCKIVGCIFYEERAFFFFIITAV
jgi:hypothetical protein